LQARAGWTESPTLFLRSLEKLLGFAPNSQSGNCRIIVYSPQLKGMLPSFRA